MAVSYKKLWKLLIDKDMKKKDLCVKAGISPASVTKMGRNGHVTTEILLKICMALDCQIEEDSELNMYAILAMGFQGNLSMAQTYYTAAKPYLALEHAEVIKKYLHIK